MNIEEWKNFIDTIRTIIEANPNLDEANTKRRIIDPLLQKLGWNTLEGEVIAEYPIRFATHTNHVDYALVVEGSPTVFVEAKALRSNLSRDNAKQLIDYGRHKEVEWCVLTNGKELRIYNSAWLDPEEENTEKALIEAIEISEFGDKLGLIKQISKDTVKLGKTSKVFNQIKQTKDTVRSLRNNRTTIESDLKEVLTEYAADSAQGKIDQATTRLVDELIEELSEYPQALISKQKSVQEKKKGEEESSDIELPTERKGKTNEESPERSWSKCKNQRDFEERIKNILETITVSNRYDTHQGWGPYIETGLDELKMIGLIPVEMGGSYGLKIEAHMGDTMRQSENLYKNPNFTMEDVNKLKKRGWGFETDFTIYHYPQGHIIQNFKTKKPREDDYFQFWQNHDNWIGQKDEEDLLSKLDEFAKQDLIVVDEKKEKEIQNKIDESNIGYCVCPGVLLSYDFDPEKAAKLDNKEKLEDSIKKRICEIVGALGNTCDFIDI